MLINKIRCVFLLFFFFFFFPVAVAFILFRSLSVPMRNVSTLLFHFRDACSMIYDGKLAPVTVEQQRRRDAKSQPNRVHQKYKKKADKKVRSVDFVVVVVIPLFPAHSHTHEHQQKKKKYKIK